MLDRIRHFLKLWRERQEIDALTDRDLADLGIARADIADLAWQNAYGEK